MSDLTDAELDHLATNPLRPLMVRAAAEIRRLRDEVGDERARSTWLHRQAVKGMARRRERYVAAERRVAELEAAQAASGDSAALRHYTDDEAPHGVCDECGSDELEWSLGVRVDPRDGIPDGRLRLADVIPVAFLSCGMCSATLATTTTIDRVEAPTSPTGHEEKAAGPEPLWWEVYDPDRPDDLPRARYPVVTSDRVIAEKWAAGDEGAPMLAMRALYATPLALPAGHEDEAAVERRWTQLGPGEFVVKAERRRTEQQDGAS